MENAYDERSPQGGSFETKLFLVVAVAKTLKSEIKLYNYFSLPEAWPELETETGRNAYINRYLLQRAGSFWDADFTDTYTKNYAAGPGLYLAIDPSISKGYGNSFVEMTVPAGAKFINVLS